jgi:6-pyruvoyltetrahydropterin/6-carboxytetrahydropterin synthase
MFELRLSTEGTFDAAHHLPNYKGKCKNIHGHTFGYELNCHGKVVDGMIVDFNLFKELDHTDLNTIIKNPTAENICLFLVTRIKLFNPSVKIASLKIWEDVTKRYEFVEYSEVK